MRRPLGARVRREVSEVCPKNEDGLHHFVREVRDAKRPGMKQDRMVCRNCKEVLYPWGGAFKPNPQAD